MARIVYDQIWSESTRTNDASLARMLLTKPDELAPVLTNLMGNEDDRFPLMYLSEGMKSTMEINRDEYEYSVIGRLRKAVPLAVTVTTASAGLNGNVFVVSFTERYFAVGYTIVTPNGYHLVVQDEGKNAGGLWLFNVKLVSKTTTSFVPASELLAGNLMGRGWYAAASYGSLGSSGFTTSPYKVRGDVSTIRYSHQYEGNVKDQFVTIPLQGKNGVENKWWAFEEYQHNLNFRFECENNYWYSISNRNSNGEITERDSQGNPVFRGSGLLEQISNKDTYGTLTAEKIKQTLRSAFYGMSDAQNKVVTMFTGILGKDMFDSAMKSELLSKEYIKLTDGKFVTGDGYALGLGGFFSTYEHVDGYKVIVKTASVFDNGVQAEVSPKHPQYSNLPLESGRMVFVDTSRYNGENNLVMVTKKGRAMVRGLYKGLNEASNGQGNDVISTTKDASSIEFLKTGQVVLRRFNTSIDLRCVAGL